MPTNLQSNGPRDSPVDEGEVVAFLESPLSYPGRVGRVDVLETHCARVFLAGTKAYKVKKRVRLPFLDFSTLELRRKTLAREIELNQPHAPEIYLRLLAITRKTDAGLEIGGTGPPVEWALEMHRFDQASLMSEIAAKGPLTRETSKKLAAMVARYHERAPAACEADGRRAVEVTLLELLSELDEAAGALGAKEVASLRSDAENALARVSALLESRALAGAVRRCHGDLHLGNIVMIEDRPVPFDALEFDEALATIDVLYDLAFLLMDLDQRGDRTGANVVLNSYVASAPLGTEIEGLRCLPLFLAMRAAVRAVVALARARQQEGNARSTTEREARRLVGYARGFLNPPRAALVAVGGFSGTGKSTLAALLAPSIGPAPGALHLRSDVERKRLFGVSEEVRLSPEHYRPAVSEEVYRLLFSKAERALAAGHAVVVDAVFASPQERTAVEAIAERAGCIFSGLWLEAPAETLMARVGTRHGDASDADAAVVRAQLARDIGQLTWTRLDARGSREETLFLTEAALGRTGLLARTPPSV